MNRRRYTEAVGLLAGGVLIIATILYPMYWVVVRIWEWWLPA